MKKWLKRISVIFLLGFLALLLIGGYAYFIEPRRLVVNENVLSVPHWSANLNGFKIVAISDIHGGSNYVTEERLRELVATANAQNPDLIVLLGDYISERFRDHKNLRMPVETIGENLKGFQARYGVYAVIGNHDWWYNEQKVRTEFEKAGIKFLENEAVSFDAANGEKIWLLGIEDFWKRRRVEVSEAMRQIEPKKNIIAITHNPDSLLQSPAEISLLLAGHSHGGQVSFPLYGPVAFVNDRRFMKGEAVVDGKHVFVTSGVGCTGPPIRFGVPPEIAVLQINSKSE
ncbi:MAG: metallophosphoesterase [Acidobacteriota bacterium]|nr:metallophosphoesterase [Acidobacteriota bacterium]